MLIVLVRAVMNNHYSFGVLTRIPMIFFFCCFVFDIDTHILSYDVFIIREIPAVVTANGWHCRSRQVEEAVIMLSLELFDDNKHMSPVP